MTRADAGVNAPVTQSKLAIFENKKYNTFEKYRRYLWKSAQSFAKSCPDLHGGHGGAVWRADGRRPVSKGRGVRGRDLLRRTETEESVIYNGKVRGEQVEITVRAAGSGNLTEVDFRIGNRIQDDCTLETGLPPIQAEQLGPVEHIRITKNDILLFEGGYDPEYGMGWYDLDGNWDPFAMSVSYSSTAGDDYWEHYETDRGTILSFARGPQLVSRGSWELYFAMLLLSALLALDAAFPLVIFHWQHMCDVKDPEPSDFYLGMQRAGWCVYPFLILIGYIIALLGAAVAD